MSKMPSYMDGKVCLVTGATSGIGRETARGLAAMGAEVIIHGRDHQKTADTAARIQNETGNENVHFLISDYSDLDQVSAMAAAFRSIHPRLDVLVNNAGAFFSSKRETPYGVEMTLLVNHLAPYLLTISLVDLAQDSSPARIINVSSNAHEMGGIDFNDLQFRHRYSGMKAYARSKLANILFTHELARRLHPNLVTVNAVHPGHTATDIWRSSVPILGRLVKWVMGFIAITPEEGAENSIYLASSPEVAGITGRYFVKHEPVESSQATYDQELAEKLWEVSSKICGVPSSIVNKIDNDLHKD